ncbi:acetoacetate-CoA ligase [Fonsecaea pedrosoi CBS 271.37]|uniref:Unplaced genomic scaffold supercont1.5, whole genome shotgun sequence n=1 Tax=Fonsecaea pedrosoi CBS 271.37 TaxID=1442368 RepID=A0A0D2GIA7_9EURO|nr:acetoacetate-CoA ligase [Fonsecaea pedrosoi CBS 271.37]KIW78340.1 acetoacetate-CoA ligase [Fonsecaea pedrosoi CBS 271.37]
MPSTLRKLWEHPDVASTSIEAFRLLANERSNLNLRNYHDLWKWSTESLNDFWMLVWEFTKVKSSIRPTYAISKSEANRLTPNPTWFPEARLNFAQNILESDFAPHDEYNTPVLTGIREDQSEVEHVSLTQLRSRVGRLANALRGVGVQTSDRVACVGSNSINTFTVFLAAASIGAIFTCCSPEMGEKGILDRFLQVRPKVLFFDDWVVYNGKEIPCLEKAGKVTGQLKMQAGLKLSVAVPRFSESRARRLPDGLQSLESLLTGASEHLRFAQVEFSHPLVVVYSSGTTGQPKCLVHTVGGVLLKQKLEQVLCTEMNEKSIYLQYTTTNWIMYLYSVSGLLSGARSILYDGSPVRPTPVKFLEMLGHFHVTHFGTSAHYLSLLEQAGVTKADVSSLDRLQVITSTGSVLTEPQYYWVYKVFGSVQLCSIAGGTDIAGAFVGGAANLPVYAGWCQARTLGMKVQIYSDEARPIEESGQAGELVCTAPFPSQPAFFWGDEDGKRYQSAYFEKFSGLWHQGDYIRMDPGTQGIQFLGRSDGVLNPSGVRFGSAEIYNALNTFTELEDCLCIGQRRPHDRDEQVLLFVKMKKGHVFSHDLEKALRERIRQDLSPRHVPKFIFGTPEIPMTVNGKKTELPVKKIVSGQKITPSSTIVNPDSLKWYEQFADLDTKGLTSPTSKL